jgi:NADPH:quinone reductase
MKAIVFDRVGPPLDVLELRDVPMPTIGDDDVLVELSVASVNPGDFFFVQGLYPPPKIPKLPGQIAGTGGGAGVVVKGGRNTSLAPGTRVAFSWFNAWSEYAAVPERWLFPLPADYPLETAAQLANVISAWDMVEQSNATSGDVIVLTGGNSAVATMALQLARRQGIDVVSIVRRASPDLDLRKWGALDVIELSHLSGPIGERIAEVTRGRGAKAVLDCVGGPLGADLVRSLALGGKAIVYGGFSPEPMSVHALELLMKASSIQTYAYRYFFEPPAPHDTPFLRRVFDASAGPDFKTRIAARHALDAFRAAVEATLREPERGKHLFSTLRR